MNTHCTHWLPGRLKEDGTREPAEPCPDVLDTEMAARLLLFDGCNSPSKQLSAWMADKGVVGFGKGKYRRDSLLAALERIEKEQ